MKNLVWLASWPKSGNTWVRILLANYLNPDKGAQDINRINETSHVSIRHLFDNALGIKSSDLTLAEIDRLYPDFCRYMSQTTDQLAFLKTHDTLRINDLGQPIFPADVTHTAVLIIRNPLDIVSSYANHYGLSLDETIAELNSTKLRSKPQLGIGTQLPQIKSGWQHHAQTWIDATMPVHIVRYEDLLQDTASAFSDLLQTTGIEPDRELVQIAVKRSAFSKLQKQEQEKDFRERPIESAAFFRKGVAGGWVDELTTEQVRQITTCNRELMTRFNYVDSTGQPIEELIR